MDIVTALHHRGAWWAWKYTQRIFR